MLEHGLIGTTSGRLILLGIWVAVCVVLSIASVVLIVARKAPPMTTQLNTQTGMREHGVGWWALLAFGFWCSGPVLVSVAWGLWRLADVAAAYWWMGPIILTGLALAAIVWFVWRRQPAEVYPSTPGPVAPAVEAAPMWSAPQFDGQWDQR